jgi:hypothetical protein
MKTLFLSLLLSAMGLSAAATNNNAGKLIRFNNKAVGSYHTQMYPTPDGGAYILYEPRIVNDSILVTRLDENGDVQWSKKIRQQAGMARTAVTPDNGLVLLTQDLVSVGMLVEKFSSSGSLLYCYKVTPQGFNNLAYPTLEVATDGTVTVALTGGTTTSYVLGPSGILAVRTVTPENPDTYNPFVTALATADGIQYTVTTSDNKPTLIKTNDTVTVYAKKYTVPGTLLGAYRIKQLHDGNLLLCGTNATLDSAFVAKINESTGQLLWAKRYEIYHGVFNTTQASKQVVVTISSFTDIAEQADGKLLLAGVCKFAALNPPAEQDDAVSLTVLNADGSSIANYYIGGDIVDVNDTSVVLHSGLRYSPFTNLFGDETDHYLSVNHFIPDSNNIALLPVSKINDLCGVSTVNAYVYNLILATTDDVTTTVTRGVPPQPQTPVINNNEPDLTSTALCLSGQNATGITALQQNNAVLLMPNPANGYGTVTVTLTDATGYQYLNLLDVTGKLLLSLQNIGNTNTINLPGLAKGSYIIQLTGAGKQTVTKQLLVTE